MTASAPCSGPYDLGGVAIEAVLSNTDYPGSAFFAMAVASYLPIYQLGETLEEVLAEPYRRTLPPVLDGAHGLGQIAAVMPGDAPSILRSDFQAEFRSQVSHPLRQAFLENNTYAWTPKAPVRLIHCKGDDVVPFANAEIAYQSFTNRGAFCVSIVDPGAPELLDHDQSYLATLREALAWFASFPG